VFGEDLIFLPEIPALPVFRSTHRTRQDVNYTRESVLADLRLTLGEPGGQTSVSFAEEAMARGLLQFCSRSVFRFRPFCPLIEVLPSTTLHATF
jgi:hypothetical protein